MHSTDNESLANTVRDKIEGRVQERRTVSPPDTKTTRPMPNPNPTTSETSDSSRRAHSRQAQLLETLDLSKGHSWRGPADRKSVV